MVKTTIKGIIVLVNLHQTVGVGYQPTKLIL
jgi:hypothetical protein